MTNNLQDIFDAIVGWDGSAAVEGWEEMSISELADQAIAQGDHYYSDIDNSEADLIAHKIVEYRESENGNDKDSIRGSIGLIDKEVYYMHVNTGSVATKEDWVCESMYSVEKFEDDIYNGVMKEVRKDNSGHWVEVD